MRRVQRKREIARTRETDVRNFIVRDRPEMVSRDLGKSKRAGSGREIDR